MDDHTIYPWQQNILDKIHGSGFKPGELKIMTSGRNIGKSTVSAQAIERLMRDLNSQPVADLVLGEGKVYGARYYTVEPVGGNWLEMEKWCGEVFGEGSRAVWGESKVPEPSCRWYANNRKFWFRNEKDRDWFIIKWNS